MSRNNRQQFKVKIGTFYFLPLLFTFNFLLLTFLSAQEQTGYDAKDKRNPFIPLVTRDGRLLNLEPQQQGTSTLTVEGIIYDKNGISCAVVNGSVVKIGDPVGEYQVLKIEEKKVIFIKEGQPLEIELKKDKEES